MPYKAFIAKYIGGKNLYLKFAPEFYSTFPHDSQIEIELPVKMLARNTFLDLINDIVRAGNRDILIVAHGSEKNGLYLDLGGRKNYWTYQLMFFILLYKKLTEKFNEEGTSKNPEKLLGVIRLIKDNHNYNLDKPADARNEIIKGLVNPTSNPAFYNDQHEKFEEYKKLSGDAKRIKCKDIIKACVEHIKAEFRYIEGFFKRKKLISDYIKSIKDVHALKIRNIAIRGCNIGQDENLLDIYRIFFNAQSINGPKVKINYGLAPVNLRGRQRFLNVVMKRAAIKFLGNKIDPANWIGGSSASLHGPKDPEKISGIYYHPEELQRNKDELLIIVRSIKNNPACYIVAEHIDVALDFAMRKFGAFAPQRRITFRRNKKSRQFEMPVCMLEQFPLTFPQDREFVQSLTFVAGAAG